MTTARASTIKTWIKNMGFKLSKSHLLESRSRKIKYYTLGNFGIYEDIHLPKNHGRKHTHQRFISWTPWGVDFEINSVRDLSNAYADFVRYNPDVQIS